MNTSFLPENSSENTKNQSNCFSCKLNSEIKRRWAIIIMSLIIICGGAKWFIDSIGAEENTSAVISGDTTLFLDSSLTAPGTKLEENDLVGILYKQNDDVYYVRRAITEHPTIEGYIAKENLNFEYKEASQGIITSDTVYTAPSEDRVNPDINAKNTFCTINEWYGDWREVSLPGGTDGIWVKASDISYDCVFDMQEAASGEFYTQIKNYLQTAYSSTYSKYYDATVVCSLDGYEESYDKKSKTLEAVFIMKAQYRNYYKNPDNVKYISDAKRLAEDTDDKYYEMLYLTYYNEYNKVNESNFAMKLTADVEHGKIKEKSIRLYNEVPGNTVSWSELENGFNDFIIPEQ